jgi:predicted MFS family arabinose efflux permease
MKFRILILALGTFAIGTDGFVIAGILPEVAGNLHVAVNTAGLLITVFAWAYAIGSPVLATATGMLERKQLLLGSMLLFVAANVLAAVSTSFAVLMIARILAACGAALYTPTALAIAVLLSPAEKRGRALALVLAGLTVATVLGVPLGILIGTQLSWQATFLVISVLGFLAIIGMVTLFPAVVKPPVVSLKARLTLLRRPVLIVMLLNLLLWQISAFVLYAYLGPLLQNITHLSGLAITGIFLLFGLANAFGNMIGGYSTDRWGATPTLAIALIVLTITQFLLPWAAASVIGIVIVVFVWGLAGWMLVSPQQHRVIAQAPEFANVVLSLNGSFIYLGIGAGAALGGFVLQFAPITSLGWVSGGLATLALGIFFLSVWQVNRGRISAPLEEQSTPDVASSQ